MDKLKNIFIKLGQLDRRFIFLLIALSVLIPLLKPGWVNIPIKTTSNSEIVFEQLNNFERGCTEGFDCKDVINSFKLLGLSNIYWGLIYYISILLFGFFSINFVIFKI